MRTVEIVAKLESLRPKFEAEGVEHLAIFGSRARGDHTESSDLDLLIDAAPSRKFSILNLVGVEHIVGLDRPSCQRVHAPQPGCGIRLVRYQSEIVEIF